MSVKVKGFRGKGVKGFRDSGVRGVGVEGMFKLSDFCLRQRSK